MRVDGERLLHTVTTAPLITFPLRRVGPNTPALATTPSPMAQYTQMTVPLTTHHLVFFYLTLALLAVAVGLALYATRGDRHRNKQRG